MKNAYRFFVALLVLTMSSLAYADPNNPYQVSDAYSADDILPYMGTNTTVQVLGTPSGAVSLYTDPAASNVPANSEGLIIGGAGNYPSIYANTEDFRNIKQIRVLSDGYLYVPNAGTDSYYSNLSVEGGSVLIEKDYINVRSAQMSISDGSLTLNRLRIGYDSGTTGKSTFTQTGGYVTINSIETGDNKFLLVGYKAGSEGELNISGGTFNSNLETKVGDSGTGTFNFSGGDFYQNAAWLNLGYESSGIGYMNVTGGNLTYLTNDFRVGRKGVGELTLESGTINLGEKNLVMGYYEGSDGTFTMTGGTLSINGLVLGEKVATETKPGAKGTANFIGVDVTIPGDSSIGSYGSGTLNLDGARFTVNPGYLYIANHTGSTAEVNLTNGAYLTEPNHAFRIGTSGTAVVNVMSGSTLENSDTNDIHIGYNANGNGTVNADNSYVNSRNIVVGNAGTGALNLTNNASSSVGNLYVGGNEDSNKYTGTGTVTLSNGATLTATSNVDIGNYGTGTMTVENASLSVGGKLYIGNHGDGGANGTVNFNSGANVNITNNIVVGKSGNGTLNVDSINLNIANYLCVGGEVDNTSSTGVGTLNLTNGAVINVAAHTMRIGQGGTGTVNVLSNSVIESPEFDIHIAYNDTSNGTLNIDGGTVNSKNVYVGNNGTGTLEVKNNSSLTAAAMYVGNKAARTDENGNPIASVATISGGEVSCSDTIYIGYDASSVGVLTVEGGKLTGANELRVGRTGNGTLTIKNDAQVTISNDKIVNIGQNADSTGVLNVEGGTFTANGELRVADLGNGTLNITGGSASAAKLVNVGYAEGSTGKVSIKNGTLTLPNSGNTFRIGRYGTGTVEVLEGGQLIVENNTTQLGYYAGGNGTLTIDGGYAKLKRLEIGYAADSTGTFEMKGGKLDILAVTDGHEINVGYSGTGKATISGGEVNATSLRVGRADGSKGELTIEGDGVMNLSSAARVSHEAGSEGTLYVKDNGQLNVTKELSIGYNSKGQVEVSGGQVNANPIVIYDNGSTLKMTGGKVTTPTITIPQVDSLDWSGGGLDVETVNGDLIQKGGVLYPGISTIVAANIVGNYTQSSEGEVVIDIDQLNNVWDTITVSGDLDLNGTLFVNFSQDEEPADTYQIFYAPNGNLDVSGMSLEFPDWYSYARMWSLNADGQLVFGADPGPGPGSGVPEPSTWALMILGFAGLLYWRKRK